MSRLKEAIEAIVDEDIKLKIETVPVEEAKLCNCGAQNFNVKEFVVEQDPTGSSRFGWR